MLETDGGRTTEGAMRMPNQVAAAERGTAVALMTLGGFQAALAGGAPWGRAAYGGAHHGTLPPRLRAISGVAALGYGTAAVLVLGGSGAPAVRARAFAGLSLVMSLGSVANGASRPPDRARHVDAGDGGDCGVGLAGQGGG